MKKFTLLLPLALAGLLAVSASAQVFVGSDNFNDNTLNLDALAGEQVGVWSYSSPNAAGAGGAWTETNQRMEFTSTAATGLNRGVLGWVDYPESVSTAGGAGLSTGNPYNSSWSAQVSVSNLMSGFASGFTIAGLEAYTATTTGGRNAYYGIYLSTNPTGANVQFESGVWNSGILDYNRTAVFASTTDVTDVLLRMSFDASTKNLALDYSFNNGATFVAGTTFDLDGAQAGLTAPRFDGIGLDLLGQTNGAGVINAGQMTFDNFSVSAIPEPSTYAAFAGLGALGLAVWRRRQARLAPTTA
jgi:hypothetical protein